VEEQIPAELEHVVERAGLGVIAVLRVLIEGSGDDVARAQNLADADAAVAVHAMRHDHVPEVLRGRVELRLAGLLEDAQVPDELRDVLVGVPTVEHYIKLGGWFAGTSDELVAFLKNIESRYPGLEHINLSTPMGTPLSIMLDQYRRVTAEVMPHFRH